MQPPSRDWLEPRASFRRAPGGVFDGGDIRQRRLGLSRRQREASGRDITYPACGHQAQERMPIDAGQYFYVCRGCGERLRPDPDECCVYCSHSDTPCPPKQNRR